MTILALVTDAFGAAGAFLLLVPFLDRRAARGERSPLFTFAALLGLAYLVGFTILAYRSV